MSETREEAAEGTRLMLQEPMYDQERGKQAMSLQEDIDRVYAALDAGMSERAVDDDDMAAFDRIVEQLAIKEDK